jgi:hypothetical protein
MKQGMVVHACNPTYSGVGGGRSRNMRPALAKLVRPFLKNKIKTKGLGHSSNGRALAYYTQVPVLKKKKKKNLYSLSTSKLALTDEGNRLKTNHPCQKHLTLFQKFPIEDSAFKFILLSNLEAQVSQCARQRRDEPLKKQDSKGTYQTEHEGLLCDLLKSGEISLLNFAFYLRLE